MTPPTGNHPTLHHLDDETRELVRLAALVTAAEELTIRNAIISASATIPSTWVEELLLQTYLFAGFPRALNAMREWRRAHPAVAGRGTPASLEPSRAVGEATCER